MTSQPIDHDGISPVVPAPTKMDILDTDVISKTEWKRFAYNTQCFDLKQMQNMAQYYKCNPKLLRQFFSSDMATRSLHEATKLGKTAMVNVI